jgi:ribosome assembly protein 4
LTNLKGHDKSVCCLKLLDSNRNHLASGSSDARILIWDCSTSSRLHTLDGHHDGSWVACLADLPSGFLVSGGGCFDGRIKVWDITKKKSIHSLKDFKKKGDWNQIYTLKALPQSQDLFVSSSSDDVIKIWNSLLGRCVKILYGHTNAVTDLEFNLSNQLLSCSKDGSIRIWEIKNVLLSVKCVRVLKGGFEQPEACLRMNKTNGKLLSGSKGAIRIWNMETGQCEHTIQTEHSITNMELCLCY